MSPLIDFHVCPICPPGSDCLCDEAGSRDTVSIAAIMPPSPENEEEEEG